MLRNTIILSILFLSSGCASVPLQKDKAFTVAVEAVQDESYIDGVNAAYVFVDNADPDDPRYDRGLKLVALSSEKLGLKYAAGMIFREIATKRRNMTIVPDALYGLKRIVESEIFDEDMIITSFIASEDFGDIPDELKAFVLYYQGLDLMRRGADNWAWDVFAKIPHDSLYFYEAEYVKAVRSVAEGDYDKAIKQLEKLNKKKSLNEKIKIKVKRTLARIAFEEKRYHDALRYFKAITKIAPEDPEILLETAWTYFYLGDARKTLGLLLALDAPVYKKNISPERYLLEALALRRLCQFGAARAAAVRLKKRYNKSIKKLGSGFLPEQIDEMRDAARYLGRSKMNSFFLESIDSEIQRLDSLKDDMEPNLYKYLQNLYLKGRIEAVNRKEQYIKQDLKELAEELLATREGMRLIIHELGVALLRGRRRPLGVTEKAAFVVPKTGKKIFYTFGGEYWTDELDDLIVIAEDRCID